ncbi:RHS repeat-associated core domain-containing protein [Paenibacillus allorhizosphaerae]|uniref:RHS repeat protein n=1 Tax=Paenibacillus allorhizosphaerae TaxID=2849866 RepID=A0ABN7TWP4_9BACL|nr:RHS repeat-associated core domain-containing protein [Paenibacillus allorhizosphaerae]CAG7658638.1 hypothetical protein PAECIP111802_07106 [Paenibacillus allorhizosphaerae]
MRQFKKFVALGVFLWMGISSVQLAHAETLDEQLNNLVGPKQQYNTMLSPVYLRHNESEERISPQSGELTLTQTDYVLPGRNGLDLEIKRIYKSGISNVQEMNVKYVDGAWVDYVKSDPKTSSFYEDRYNMGIGMRFSFPSIEVRKNDDGTSHNFLHTDSGDVYRLQNAMVDGKSVYLLEGQTIKDVIVKETTEYSNGQTDGTSKLVMTGKDGKKTYFAEDGRLLGIVDRYGNTIKFEYSTLTYTIDGQDISKRLLSSITDTIGRVITIEYKEDATFTVSPIGSGSYGAENSYNAMQNPNSVDSGDLQGKFQVIIRLPGDKQLIYDKSAVLVSPSKHVLRTRLQRMFDTDGQVKYHYWYEQQDLGFSFLRKDLYLVYNRHENLVQIDYTKTNRIKRYVYNSYTKRLNEGRMQYRKMFEQKELVKKGFDPGQAQFLDKFVTEVKDKTQYTYTNEADGYGYEGYKEHSQSYLKDTYRYYTELTDIRGNLTKYTYNGIHELVVTEKLGTDHKEVITHERDEMKLVKKQETALYPTVDGQSSDTPVRKIENYRYDEYGNLTNYTGPEAARGDSGYPADSEHTVVYAYAYDKFHALTQKTWKQAQDQTSQTIYTVDALGNVTKETRVNPLEAGGSVVTDYDYDRYGNVIRKSVASSGQAFETRYEYGKDADGADTQGAYVTKEYSLLDGRELAKTYAYNLQTGQRTAEVDPRGNRTSNEYDVLGRLVKTTLADNSAKTFRYEQQPYANMRIGYTDPDGNTLQNEYDIQGNLIQASVLKNGDWSVLTRAEYDAKGNKIKEIDANGHSTRFAYDSRSRLVSKSYFENDQAEKGTVSIRYTLGADEHTPLLMTMVDEEGYEKRMYFDIMDRLRKTEVTAGKSGFDTTTYTYDYVGNKRLETDGRNNSTELVYDPLGRQRLKRDALGNETAYSYNALGKVSRQQEPGGRVTQFEFDALGRVTRSKNYQLGAESDITYTDSTYDAAGNVERVKQGRIVNGEDRLASDISYVYDAMNRVSEQSIQIDESRSSVTAYDYDHNGNKIKTVEYADAGRTKFRVTTSLFDYAGNVIEESGAYREPDATGGYAEYGSYLRKYERDDVGNVTKDKSYNGSGYDTTEYSYSYRNKPVEKVEPYGDDGQSFKKTQYTYDKKGNLLTETLTVHGVPQTKTYVYDGLGRVVRKIDPLGQVTRYAYDSNGNRIKEVDPRFAAEDFDQAAGTEYEYDALNRPVKRTVFDGKTREVTNYRAYDSRGNLVLDADGEGYNANQPQLSIGKVFTYDYNNRKVVEVSAEILSQNRKNGTQAVSMRYQYDVLGHVAEETDALGHTTRYTYYLNGLLKDKTYPDGSKESTDYDLSGKAKIAKTDPLGHVIVTYLTIFNKPYLIEYPDGTSQSSRYSPKGELIESKDQEGNVKTFAYDPSGNLIRKKEFIRTEGGDKYSKLTKLHYDESNRSLSSETFATQNDSETSMGDRIENTYDKAGRLTKVSGSNGREAVQEYDRAGNVIAKLQKTADDEYEVRRYVYDVQSRLVQESLLVKTSDLSAEQLLKATFDNVYFDRVKSTTVYSYYKNGKQKSQTDTLGQTTQFEYDYDLRPTKKVDPLKAATVYRYDLKGNLTEQIDAKNVSTRFEYDELDRAIRKKSPAASGGVAVTRYQYDAAGNLIKQIAPKDYDPAKDAPQQLNAMPGMTYAYDALNRRISTTDPDGTGIEYIAYTPRGQVKKQVNGVQYTGDVNTSKGTEYDYDGLGQVIRTTNALGYVTLVEYDALGHVTKLTDARGNATLYSYHSEGTLEQVTFADGGTISYAYDKLGRKTKETNQLGLTTTFEYNAFGKEKTVKDAEGNTVESKYDLAGNLVTQKDKRGSVTLLKYDAANRLIEKRVPLELDASGNTVYAVEGYAYDPVGNVLKKSLNSSKDKSFYRETVYTYYDNNLVNTISDSSGAFAKNDYDRNGNLVKLEKLRDMGQYDTEKYVYDRMDRLIQRIRFMDENVLDADTGYAAAVELKDAEYPGKIRQITGYEYDAAGNRTKEIDPRAYAFDASDTGNHAAYTTLYTYDALNQLKKVTRQVNGADVSKLYSYDENGNKVSERDERGNETKYAYDSVNRLKSITDASNKTLTYGYDLAGNKTSETNAKGYSMTYSYDKLNRLSTVTDPYNVIVSKNIYDENGNVVKKIDAKGYASAGSDEKRYGVVYTYDLANRVVLTIDPEIAAKNNPSLFTTKVEYNPAGQKTKETNALGNVQSYEYDSAGKLLKVTDPLGVEVTYGYDKSGYKLYMIDGRGKVTQYEYGTFGLLKETTDAMNRRVTYRYDLTQNVAVMTDRNGRNTRYVYDSHNLLLSKTVVETDEKISYTYDAVGNRSGMTDESGMSAYTYDEKNQLVMLTKDGAIQLEYTYDEVGNIGSIKDKTGATTMYTYDKTSRMETVAFQGKTTTYRYDANGNRKAIVYEGGVQETYVYDKNNKLLELTNKKQGGGEISSYSYTYDDAGRQVTKTDSFGTTNYSYDAAGRIEKVEAPGKTTVYTYDHAGNRQSFSETYTSAQPSSYIDPNDKTELKYTIKKSEYVYSNANELLQLVETMQDDAGKKLLEKTTSYLYDDNGNELRQKVSYLRPHTRSMHQVTGGNLYGDEVNDALDALIEKVSNTFDGFNRLKQVEQVKAEERVTVEYVYNGDDLRTKKTIRSSKDDYLPKVSNYLYDQQHVILETNEFDEVVVKYISGINYIARMDRTDKVSYYLFNGHGDVVQTVNETGQVENQYDYDVFGNLTLTIEMYANEIRYSGEFFDEKTGLYYLRARYYNPHIGRFISEDTYEGHAEDPLSLNRYTYCNNEPILHVDPSGHVSVSIDIDGTTLEGDNLTGKTTVGLRDIATAMGGSVSWSSDTRMATVELNGKTYDYDTTGTNKVIVNLRDFVDYFNPSNAKSDYDYKDNGNGTASVIVTTQVSQSSSSYWSNTGSSNASTSPPDPGRAFYDPTPKGTGAANAVKWESQETFLKTEALNGNTWAQKENDAGRWYVDSNSNTYTYEEVVCAQNGWSCPEKPSGPADASKWGEDDSQLGILSKKYESKGKPGTISGGGGDVGGASYGAYQFASTFNVPLSFAKWLEGKNDDYYNRLITSYKGDGNKYGAKFNSTWEAIANENNSAFLQLQHDYTKVMYYDITTSKLKKDIGFDANQHSFALKNVIWSRSVHHGATGGANVIKTALSGLDINSASEEEIIRAIYAESGSGSKNNLKYFSGNSAGIQAGVWQRLNVDELNDALKMLSKEKN